MTKELDGMETIGIKRKFQNSPNLEMNASGESFRLLMVSEMAKEVPFKSVEFDGECVWR